MSTAPARRRRKPNATGCRAKTELKRQFYRE
jgi:hypothetical protein